jgi:hypothetical protein
MIQLLGITPAFQPEYMIASQQFILEASVGSAPPRTQTAKSLVLVSTWFPNTPSRRSLSVRRVVVVLIWPSEPGPELPALVGLLLGGATGVADLDLALRRASPGGALLDHVRQLVRHEPEIAAALAGPEEHIAAVRERARTHGMRCLLAQRILVNAHCGEIGAEVRTNLGRHAGIDRLPAALVLDRGRRCIVDRRRIGARLRRQRARQGWITRYQAGSTRRRG